MNATVTGQIVSVPSNIWYVYINGRYNSMWGSRDLARARKTELKSYGLTNVTISSSAVTLGQVTRDMHS